PDGAGRLLGELARAGVMTAASRHRDALLADPARGNEDAFLAAEASGGRILPVAVVAPIRSADPAMDVGRAVARGAVAFWLGTATWYASPATPSAATDALLGAVARTGRPLLIPVERWGDATAIGERTAHLGLPVVLVGAHYTHITDDLAAAERWPHLHLETSRLAHLAAVETAVRRIGHERLLLGTGAPDRPPTAPINAVLGATIPDAAKRAILGGNAARVLGLVDHPPVTLRPPLTAGGAIDVHGHLAPAPWDVPDLRPGALADAQAARGIVCTVASSVVGIAAHAPSGNTRTVADVAGEPRLRGYLVADARDLPATRRDLARHGDAAGVAGVKVHCQWGGTPTASPLMMELFVLLAAHGRPVKIHVDGEGWEDALRSLALTHPRLPIIVAHGGPGTPSLGAARVAAETPNVHLELASSFASLSEVRAVVSLVGIDRLLFGTDSPLLEPSFVLGTYADAGLTPATHPGVFHDAASRLFGITVSGARA
ncbi:MAG: amidohydrolase family protein, partial [Thermoleophilia bacterium]|nr:amidohydrolase family protein [Thermoleophilia bacterium]